MDLLSDLAIRLDPALVLDALGLDPDPWQRSVMRSNYDRILMLCARQSGKSTVAAALACVATIFDPTPGLVLALSPGQRQSGLLFAKVIECNEKLGWPVPSVERNATTLSLANGAKVVSLPGSPDTIRGFSAVKLLLIDEAAFARNDLLEAVSPMIAVSGGRLVALTTPAGCRGWFYHAWEHGGDQYQRVRFTAAENPRISPEFLAEERIILSPRQYSQEYECVFNDAEGQVFSEESIEAAFDNDLLPLFGSLAS